MKISILTFSKEVNYGANLQCYALTHYLQKLGHEVDIIDIQLPEIKYGILYRILTMYDKYLFNRFRNKHLNFFTRKFKDVNELYNNPPKSDLYIVGSDQVWNPDITKRLDPKIYFFSFLPENSRRISYAASFGTNEWGNISLTEDIKSLLKKFEAISVREKEGVNICKSTFDLEAKEVIDPTLLLDSYNEICDIKPSTANFNKVVYFKFINDKKCEKVISNFCKNNQLKPIHLAHKKPIKGFIFKPFVSIENWLGTIKSSRFIITDSFHCTVFCILMKKEFIVLPSIHGRANRMLNLLDNLNLSNRFCKDSQELSKKIDQLYHDKIDYNSVYSQLDILRNSSKIFINSILNKK